MAAGQGVAAVAYKRSLPASVKTTHCSAKLASPALVTPPSGLSLAWVLRDWLHLLGLLLYRQKPNPQHREKKESAGVQGEIQKKNQDSLLCREPVSATMPRTGPTPHLHSQLARPGGPQDDSVGVTISFSWTLYSKWETDKDGFPSPPQGSLGIC